MSCVHELFEAQAARSPQAVAVIDGSGETTYETLDQRVNQLAHRLRRLGVGPERLVAILLERNLDMIVAMLATLKAGGGYVALNPAHPPERLAGIVADCRAQVVLTETDLRGRLPAHPNVVVLDAERAQLDREPTVSPGSSVDPRNVACLVYTSGSTGQPKGVAIEHRSVANLAVWAGEVFDAADLAVVLAGSPTSCDCALFEILTPLVLGGGVLLAPSALDLPRLPAARHVTLVPVPATTMSELLRAKGVPSSVRVVNLSGETVGRDLVDDVYRCTSAQRVFNLYGVSEAAMYSTCTLVAREAKDHVSAGGPIANTSLHVLDEQLREVPPGGLGELCVGGIGVARGYLGQPALTAERFVAEPSGGRGARLYRTGDLAERLADGTVRVLGRLDHQVKIRGFRVELGDVESGLRRLPGVHDAVVVAHRDDCDGAKLIAYVVPAVEDGSPSRLEPATLRDLLSDALPHEMVPAAIVPLDHFPTAPNGKVDRRALPAVDLHEATAPGPSAPADDPLERGLQRIWSAVLRIQTPGVHDDFLAIGGDSLLASRVVCRVRDELGYDLPLRTLFEVRTIAALADHIRVAEPHSTVTAPPLVALPRR